MNRRFYIDGSITIYGGIMNEKSIKHETPSVRIREDQVRWLRENGINLSEWVRNKIDEEKNDETPKEELEEIREEINELKEDNQKVQHILYNACDAIANIYEVLDSEGDVEYWLEKKDEMIWEEE